MSGANLAPKISSRTCMILHKSSRLFQPMVAVQKNLQVKNQDVTSKSQRLLLDAGVIKQASPGSFHYLPLGVRSFEKLTRIVDEEMSKVGAQKVMMPTLTAQKLWKATGRLEDVNAELFKLIDRHNVPYILSPTHEEAAADLIANTGTLSYREYPIRLYQISSKFRDEMKPRFGLMRGRQFIMKDLYCFDVDLEHARETYAEICDCYNVIFKRIGMEFIKVLGTTGNMGGSISHEYHYLSDIGEDKIVMCSNCNYKANTELNSEDECPQCRSKSNIHIKNGIEVGHTFLLGDKYSKALKAMCLGANGKPEILQMGSYGLGLSRILAACVEVQSLEHEIRWPKALAPYTAVIITPKVGSKEELSTGDLPIELYAKLNSHVDLQNNILYDDRSHMTIGRRILEAKRTGFPYIIVIGTKAMENPPLVEVIDLIKDDRLYLTHEQVYDFMRQV